MEQQIGFCTTSDGVRIAYATLGDGPPLVYVCGWPGHLGLGWEGPFPPPLLHGRAPVLSPLDSAAVAALAGALSMPTLVMHGRRDRAIPFLLGRELAASLPQAKFVPFEASSTSP